MMRIVFFFLVILSVRNSLHSQQRCASADYSRKTYKQSIQVSNQLDSFVTHRLNNGFANARPASGIIKIPVVVHIVYHTAEDNIPVETIYRQIEALNRDYRRKNADTTNTPLAFRSKAADVEIEFELAKTDPLGRATNGIERNYSPITSWDMDDKVKSIATYGATGWDARYYLNIWICNLRDVLGYSSQPGDDANNDGIVLSFAAVNNLNDGGQYSMGRTAVHEAGHWLGLYHLWGDADCGDDKIADTPKQTTYTPGCPSGVRVSCNNSADGDMYMNFMDFTDDPCLNLFTNGQKQRMRVLFEQGGFRNSILASKALDKPWSQEIPLPDDAPQWLYAQVYPNPTRDDIVIDFSYDIRWIGKEIVIVSAFGQVVHTQLVSSKVQTLQTARLLPGIYFIRGKKEGEKLSKKFVKM